MLNLQIDTTALKEGLVNAFRGLSDKKEEIEQDCAQALGDIISDNTSRGMSPNQDKAPYQEYAKSTIRARKAKGLQTGIVDLRFNKQQLVNFQALDGELSLEGYFRVHQGLQGNIPIRKVFPDNPQDVNEDFMKKCVEIILKSL
jgi:hypothetical protein